MVEIWIAFDNNLLYTVNTIPGKCLLCLYLFKIDLKVFINKHVKISVQGLKWLTLFIRSGKPRTAARLYV